MQTTRTQPPELTDEQRWDVCETAQNWHGGQWSAFYALQCRDARPPWPRGTGREAFLAAEDARRELADIRRRLGDSDPDQDTIERWQDLTEDVERLEHIEILAQTYEPPAPEDEDTNE